jgi:hypothetical protein
MWKDLAPKILRQRLVIEGTTKKIVDDSQIQAYLLMLAKEINMKPADIPIIFTEHEKGSAAYINWTSSGCHFYSYPTKPPLFTIDIYSCKKFSIKKTIMFTKKFFNTIEIVWKEV